MDLTVEVIQERLRQLLRNQVAVGKEHIIDTISVAVARSACLLSGIPEEDVRTEINSALNARRKIEENEPHG